MRAALLACLARAPVAAGCLDVSSGSCDVPERASVKLAAEGLAAPLREFTLVREPAHRAQHATCTGPFERES